MNPSGLSWNSVHKRDVNCSERRKLSAVAAVGTPALGKTHGDTHGSTLWSGRENAPECLMAENALLCRRDAGQKYSICRRSNRRPSKKGNNPECRGLAATGQREVLRTAAPLLFREDETIRFPVKVRKDRIRQIADPSSRQWKKTLRAAAHRENYMEINFFAGRTVKGGGNQSFISRAAECCRIRGQESLPVGRPYLLIDRIKDPKSRSVS